MGNINEIQKQEFDFTDEINRKNLNEWEAGLRDIPLVKKNYWLQIGEKIDDEDDRIEAVIKTTHQFIDMGNDDWFWLNILFKKDGTALASFVCSYSTSEEYRWLPAVNKFLKQIGFEETDELSVLPDRELATWQEGYDLLCNIARKTKVPKFEK